MSHKHASTYTDESGYNALASVWHTKKLHKRANTYADEYEYNTITSVCHTSMLVHTQMNLDTMQ